LAFTNDTDLQRESMEQVENGYHIETKIEAITPQFIKKCKKKFMTKTLQCLLRWWKIALSW
jgi:hypothetical protein